jgi:multiple antibiotic resistance protein
MSSIVEHGLSVFMAFFAIMNPIANTTVFASLSENLNYDERRKLAAKGILIAFVTIVAFALIEPKGVSDFPSLLASACDTPAIAF